MRASLLACISFGAIATAASWKELYSDSEGEGEGEGEGEESPGGVDSDTGLLLSPLVRSGRSDEARELSKVEQFGGHSGYISTDDADLDRLFFWFFHAREPRPRTCTPLIMWLQGGPGATSQYGNLVEMGPVYLSSNETIANRTWTWNTRYAMLFVDQPVWTGYSYSVRHPKQHVKTSNEAASKLYVFVEHIFALFPEYKCSPFWIAGESYGGHYVPHTASYIHTMNAALGQADPRYINLAGLMIGNPDLDQASQNRPIPDLLYNFGQIDHAEREYVRKVNQEVEDLIAHGKFYESWVVWNQFWGDCCPCPGCEDNTYTYLNLTGSDNPLDMRTSDESPMWGWVGPFLNLTATKKALHAKESIDFHLQSNDVYIAMAMSGDVQNATLPLLPDLISNYPVLLYAGQQDATLGVRSLYAAVDKMFDMPGAAQWKDAWSQARKATWRLPSPPQLQLMGPEAVDLAGYVHDVAGYAHSIATSDMGYGKLTVVTVMDAGHIAPGNQPISTLDMLHRFIDGRGFVATDWRASPFDGSKFLSKSGRERRT